MKRLTNFMCLALLCAAIGCNDATTKTDESIQSKPDSPSTTVADQTPTVQDSAAMMKAWQEYMTPGEMHAMLAKDNGVWNAEVTMWMSPDAPPQKSTGVATNKMILGGRYQQATFKGNFNGMPFEGLSTLAYDNSKKKFVNTWIDNMGTGIMTMEGTYDAATKTINFEGSSTDPTTGKECKMREIFKPVDENTQVMEMYATYPGGKEYKSMEITYKRKK
ncbi:MAG TPA: DUF1579 domain-containing protein [Chitinophagaceae bacterium]